MLKAKVNNREGMRLSFIWGATCNRQGTYSYFLPG